MSCHIKTYFVRERFCAVMTENRSGKKLGKINRTETSSRHNNTIQMK